MRILYLAQLVPYPADAGPKIRMYYGLRYLAAAGHQVTLLAFRRPDDTPEAINHLAPYCQEIQTVLMPRSRWLDGLGLARSLLANQPFLIARDHVPAMYRAIHDLTGRETFDVIHADQLWMAPYALAAKQFSHQRPRTVLDQHNAVYLIPKRMAAQASNPLFKAFLALEARKMARYEVNTCAQFDSLAWVSEEDRAALAAVSGREEKGQVIPICVDTASRPVIARRPNPQRITFMGGLHWPPNREGISWFAQQVWPQVAAQFPETVLTIIGKNPPAGLPNNQVEVTGYVPDPLPYLAETAVFIVPLHAGGGMRVKILDAWSYGLPIVSTTIGAEGLRYQHNHNLLIADTAESFAGAVVRLLQQPTLQAQLGQSGRDTVENYYDWQKIYPAWEGVLHGSHATPGQKAL